MSTRAEMSMKWTITVRFLPGVGLLASNRKPYVSTDCFDWGRSITDDCLAIARIAAREEIKQEISYVASDNGALRDICRIMRELFATMGNNTPQHNDKRFSFQEPLSCLLANAYSITVIHR